jgi:hypothetical protein
MKRASQQLIGDSAGTTDQYETTAQFLEDLAAHSDNDKKRRRCLAAARDFRLKAQNKLASRKLPKGKAEPGRCRPKSWSGGQYG